ncbi:MAG: BamA/TamA family outer membrane protein [Candidatus Eisenbacteria bacterium]|nr:BamA/TamA family outer membrane protein [Candidatus Eisenbacteria bacterium]
MIPVRDRKGAWNGFPARWSLPLLLLSLLLLAGPARAYDPMTLPSTAIRSLTIEGNLVFSDEEIRDRMSRTKGGWFHSGRYRATWLARDLEDVIRQYNRAGYLGAEISEKRVVPDRERGSVAITIRIEEGERTLVGAVSFEGLPGEASRERLLRMLGLQAGAPYNRELLPRDQVRIYGRLAEIGYPEAEVEHVENIGAGAADVLFRIRSGPRVRIGPVTVEGTENTRPRFVLRELTFHEGDWYDRTRLLDSRDRVYQTGYYYNVAMIRDPLDGKGAVPIRISIKEKKLRWFGFGGGFGTEDQFRFSFDWTNRNVLRTGRTVYLETVFSELFADRDFEQKYTFSIIEPWMFRTRTVGMWKVTHERMNLENFVLNEGSENERTLESYRLIQTATAFSLSRDLNKRTKGSIIFSLEWAKAEEPSEPVDEELLRPDITRSLAFTFERDVRDHLLDPTAGSRLHTSVEFAGTFLGGDNEFFKETLGGALYRRVPGRAVLALRAQAGGLRSLAPDDALPDYKRFRLGGANSVRGYREEAIGPANYMFLANAEARFPLFWRLGGVLFIDAGAGWQRFGDAVLSDWELGKEPEEVTRDDVRYGVGGGLRVYTPFGPLRVDYGRKLKPRVTETGERESRDLFHFSIGQAF